MKDIVAVANGKALLASGKGGLIDAFTHVVRFNHAVLDGYVADVGSKTTIWACANWPENMYSENLCRFSDCQRLFVMPDAGGSSLAPIPQDATVIPREFERELRGKVRPSDGMWCTTGIIALAWLLETHEVVHTAGWFEQGAACDPAEFLPHYETPGKPNSGHPISHDVQAESSYFRSLVSLGRVIPI